MIDRSEKKPPALAPKKHPLEIVYEHLSGVIQGEAQRKQFVKALAELHGISHHEHPLGFDDGTPVQEETFDE